MRIIADEKTREKICNLFGYDFPEIENSLLLDFEEVPRETMIELIDKLLALSPEVEVLYDPLEIHHVQRVLSK